MNLSKDNLPDGFMMSATLEYNDFRVEFDAGDYDKYDELFDKYDLEPSGYDWEAVFVIYLKANNSNLIEKIYFDCEGDTFFCIVKSEKEQIQLVKHLLALLEDEKELERNLRLYAEQLKREQAQLL